MYSLIWSTTSVVGANIALFVRYLEFDSLPFRLGYIDMLVERIGLPKSLISSSLEISMCEKPLRDFLSHCQNL